MTRREMLVEQYEDALFALLMDEVAEAEGQKALEENQRLRESGELVVPDGVRQRCQKVIAHKTAVRDFKRIRGGFTKVVTKVAIVVLVAMLLFTTAFAVSEDFRVKTLNLVLEVFEDHTEITLEPDESIASSVDSVVPQLTAGWLPEGFALVEEGGNSVRVWKNYLKEDTETRISIFACDLRSGGMNFDTEEVELLPIQINGSDAFLINDTEAEIIQIMWRDDAASEWLICVVGKGVSEGNMLKTAKNVIMK